MPDPLDGLEGVMREHMLAELPDDGSGELANMKLSDLLYAFGAYRPRPVSASPRQVYISPELETSARADDHRAELEAIVAKIKAGDDLRPHFSRSIDYPLSLDRMLANLGVHHLHLSQELEPNGRFVKRTGNLLFVAFRPEHAYLIGIYGHKTDWALKEILEIVARNWPTIGIVHELRSVVGFEQDFDDETRLELQNAGISASGLMVEGKAFTTLGQTAAGAPVAASMFRMKVVWMLNDWRDNLDERLAEAAQLVDEAAGRKVGGEWTPIIYDGCAGLLREDVFHAVISLA
jgi:hypothetical protein